MEGAAQCVQAGVREGGGEGRGEGRKEGVGREGREVPEEEGGEWLKGGGGVEEVEEEEALWVGEREVCGRRGGEVQKQD